MKRLALIDDAFLRLESRRQPLHIGVLMLFEPPPGEAHFAVKLAERLRQSTLVAEPFNRLLIQKRGLHYWEADAEFDLEHHFVHTSLPKPGRIRELLAMVSRVHSSHLDRAYPLWRIYLIEGIEDGRIAVYFKIHHSVVDGVAAIRILSESMADSPEKSLEIPPPWAVHPPRDPNQSRPLQVVTPAVGGLSALLSLSREKLRSTKPLLEAFWETFRDFRAKNPDLVVGGQAPKTLFNSRISATRRLAAQSYSTSRMRAVGKSCNVTLNDVVLAMCGGALRSYLKDLGQLPDLPLVAGIPVSTRQEGDDAFGNEVAFTLSQIATHVEDPLDRLKQISRCMNYNKQRLRKLPPEHVMSYAALSMMPGVLLWMSGPRPRADHWHLVHLTRSRPASADVLAGRPPQRHVPCLAVA